MSLKIILKPTDGSKYRKRVELIDNEFFSYRFEQFFMGTSQKWIDGTFKLKCGRRTIIRNLAVVVCQFINSFLYCCILRLYELTKFEVLSGVFMAKIYFRCLRKTLYFFIDGCIHFSWRTLKNPATTATKQGVSCEEMAFKRVANASPRMTRCKNYPAQILPIIKLSLSSRGEFIPGILSLSIDDPLTTRSSNSSSNSSKPPI